MERRNFYRNIIRVQTSEILSKTKLISTVRHALLVKLGAEVISLSRVFLALALANRRLCAAFPLDLAKLGNDQVNGIDGINLLKTKPDIHCGI